jgi:diguanylate cyclase (GGDEF)-like protein
LELLTRLSSATEELEDIVQISTGAKRESAKTGAIHSRFSLSLRKKNLVNSWPMLQLFRDIVLTNLLAGRMASECYLSGRKMASYFKIKKLDDIKTACAKIGFEIDNIHMDDSCIRARIRKSPTASYITDAKHPVCYLESGLLAGLFENLVKKRLSFKEKTCKAVSGGSCLFTSFDLKPEEVKDIRIGKGMLPLLPADQYSEENIRLLTSLATHALTAIENTFLFERTKRQSLIDALTGLYNHRYFHDALKAEMKRASRFSQPLSLMMIDLDGFKEINDNCGHPKGDKILQNLAKIFISSVREIDVVARYGGDEFVIILPQTSPSNARVVAKRIQKAVGSSHFVQHEGKNVQIAVSVGISGNCMAKDDAHKLIALSDQALLSAKRRGAGKIVVIEQKAPAQKKISGPGEKEAK